MDINELKKARKAKLDQARAIADKWKGKEDQMPSADLDQITTLLGASDVDTAKIDAATRLSKGEELLRDVGTLPVSVSWREGGAAKDEGTVEFDPKAFRKFEVMTPLGKKEVRYHIPLVVQKKGYDPAFEAYLRFGFAAMKDFYPSDAKTLLAGTDTAGGFLIPESFHADLIKKTMGLTAVRPNARVVQGSRDVETWPIRRYSTDDKYTSGVRVTWTGELPASSTASRVTDQTYGQINIPAGTMMLTQPVSNNLIEDAAFDVLGDSTDAFAEAKALGEDDAFLNGVGAGQPMGILTEAGTNGPAQVASGTSSQIFTGTDAHNGKRLIDLYYKVPAQYRKAAVWLMTSLTMAAAENLVDAQKRPIVSSLINASMAMGEPVLIKNRPVFIDEFVPEIGASSNSIIFGDLHGYIITDRVGVSMQRLSELYAETNITLLLLRCRLGGYCAEPYKIKVLNCA